VPASVPGELGVRFAAEDASERLAAVVSASEARYRQVLDLAAEGIWVTDADDRTTFANPRMGELLGVSCDELLGRSPHEFMDEDGLAIVAGRLGRCKAGAGEVADFRLRRADGADVWASMSSTLIMDDDGAYAGAVSVVSDVTERKALEARLRHLADHDPLTDLLNRRGFEAELTRQVARSARYGPDGALLLLDIDNLKHVNDTLGHSAGDQLIVGIAHALRRRLRASDILARIGGDELTVILPRATAQQAECVAAALVDAVRHHVTTLPGGRRAQATTSLGVAVIDRPGLTAADLLAQADIALYTAKGNGRDRYSVFGAATVTDDMR